MTRDRGSAEKMFKLVKVFLKEIKTRNFRKEIENSKFKKRVQSFFRNKLQGC